MLNKKVKKEKKIKLHKRKHSERDETEPIVQQDSKQKRMALYE